MFAVFIATYAAVFIAEIAGDKLLYTTGVLAIRYRSLPIVLGMALAFMLKMGAAVMLGSVIAQLPKPVIAALTAASFIGVMIVLWRKNDDLPGAADPKSDKLAAPTLVTFATIFLSEWADVGMITAATMAANHFKTSRRERREERRHRGERSQFRRNAPSVVRRLRARHRFGALPRHRLPPFRPHP